MTPEAQRIAIAEACGTIDRWVIMKRGLYYRPKAQGYTNNIQEAWVVTGEEADKHVYPHDTPVTKHRAPLPDYLNDLNAMHEAEASLSAIDLMGFDRHLSDVCFGSTQRCIHATSAQRAEAFLRTIGKWKGEP